MTASVDMRAVLEAVRPQLDQVVVTLKDNFVEAFGDFVASAHKERLEAVILEAGRAKVACFFAATEEEAQEQHEICEAAIESLETLGLAVEISGGARARAFLKSSLRQALSLIPVVAGAVLRVAIPAAIPVAGAIAGPVLALGAEWLLKKFFPPVAA